MADLAFVTARLAEDEKTADALAFACRDPARRPVFDFCGGPAAEAFWQRFCPDRMLREVEAKRRILAAATARSHRYLDDDPWHSCAQAVEPGDDTPGSGCLNEARAGGPCDCGRDAAVETVVRALAGAWGDHEDWRP